MHQPSRFVAGLTPLPTAARVTQQRGALRMRLITSVISLVLLVVFIVLFGKTWSTGWTITIVVLWVLSTAFWFLVTVDALRRAKRDLGLIPEGDAFYLDPQGIEFVFPNPATPVKVAWAEITRFRLAGRNFGAGPVLSVEANGQEVARVPVSFLDATPAVIDSAAQAYSLGRVRLDTEALDNVF